MSYQVEVQHHKGQNNLEGYQLHKIKSSLCWFANFDKEGSMPN